MGKEKQGIVVLGLEKPVTELVTKYREFETNCKNWLAKPSLPAEAAYVTVTCAAEGAALSLLFDTVVEAAFSVSPLTVFSLKTYPELPQALSVRRLVEARNFAVLSGVKGGIRCVMKKLRGKEDVQTRMAAGFGAGLMYSLVRGHQPAEVVLGGVLFGLLNGGVFKATEMLSHQQEEDLLYNETRGMLSTLGYDKFEKNFKKGMLTDRTLPLVTDCILQEVKIPPGARLRILDHIKRGEKASQEVGGDLAD